MLLAEEVELKDRLNVGIIDGAERVLKCRSDNLLQSTTECLEFSCFADGKHGIIRPQNSTMGQYAQLDSFS